MSNRGGTVQTSMRGVTTKPLSAKQRGEKATLSLRQALNLPSMTYDAAVLGAAIAEIASEESRHNKRFADAIRARYYDLMTQLPLPKRESASPKEDLPPLVPIRRIEEYRADPFSPPNPRFLTQLYGYSQLDRALQDYTVSMLKETAAKVQQDHPGTKPTSRAVKQSLIDYIVTYSSKE